MSYVNLFNETHYSMNGATSKIDDLITKTVKLNYSFLAITDNKLHGIPKFYKKCLEANLKAVIGLNTSLTLNEIASSVKVLMFAKNNNGYKNIMKISSIDSSESSLSLDSISAYTKDIVLLVITKDSIIEKNLKDSNDNYLKVIELLNSHFKDVYYSVLNSEYDKLLSKDVKMLVLEHSRYIDKSDALVSKALEKIFNKNYQDIFSTEESYHFKSLEEIKEKYKGYDQEISNTIALASLCNVTLDFSKTHLPKFNVTQDNVTAQEYLRALVFKGLDKRLVGTNKNKGKYIERLNYELGVINEMGYDDYFLIVWDFVKYSRKNKYLVGPGRGSAAGSLVSYCLGITSVDSLEYNLVFERFLNPHRITMPDIDMDFPDDKRDDIIKYVRDFYGKDHVASICTFGTFQKKSCLRDAAKILDTKPLVLEEILKEAKKYESLNDMLKNSSYIASFLKQDIEAKNLIEIASGIEGLVKHISTHAAGIIVSDGVITEHSPVQPGLLDMIQTQYEAKELEDLGLLKIDFLGLRNLTIIDKTLDLIKKHENIDINIYKLPLDDEKTYDLLKNVNTAGVFQLESTGMKSLIRQMQIDCFEDIVTVLALFRPGPMENIPSYIKRRDKVEVVTFQHEVLEETLESTNGIIIYQEQILQILNLFAGYDLGEADVVRRAVSKKNEQILNSERARFIEKSKIKGHDEVLSNEIYDYIVKFANYGFNRSHSVAYAMVAYWTAYLKANYPKYYLSVLSSSVTGSENQTKNYILEANKLGIKVLSPHINLSFSEYVVKKDSLIYPLLGIKSLGLVTVQKLIEERENGPYKTYQDFISRTHTFLSNNVIEALIYSGSLDSFDLTKRTMIDSLETALEFIKYANSLKKEDILINYKEEYSFDFLREKEKEVLGFNLSIHLISKYDDYIRKHKLLKPSDITDSHVSNKEYRIVASLSRIKEIKTKKGQAMAFIDVEDEFNSISGVIFTTLYNEIKPTLETNKVYLFLAKIEKRNNSLQLVIMKTHTL